MELKKILQCILLWMCMTFCTHAQIYIQKGTDIDGEMAYDQSGQSVSLSSDGNTVAIGAPDNSGSAPAAGKVSVYAWNGGFWVRKGTNINGGFAYDQFGRSISLSSDGNILAIGAPGNDENGPNTGHVRVFQWDGESWIQKGTDIKGEVIGVYRISVTLSSDGNSVAIGTLVEDGNGPNGGHVRVFQWEGGDWTKKGTNINGEATDDMFGRSVSLSSDGNTMAIGSPGNNGNGIAAGQVRVLQWDGMSWALKGTAIEGEAAIDQSGLNVSLSSDGNTVAIGARRHEGQLTGKVKVFQWDGILWIQKGTSIIGESEGDGFNIRVSLSADGNTMAIGAPENDGNGPNAGHVRIFQWDGASWMQKGTNINGEAAGDISGRSISLNSNGNTVAIGAPWNNGNGTYTGHVRVYAYSETVGLAEKDLNDLIRIYPNPAHHFLNIETEENTILRLFDSKGVLLKSFQAIGGQPKRLDMSGVESGIFLLAAFSENGAFQFSQKILVSH